MCGDVEYVWELGVPQQQIVNLGWYIALQFTPSHDYFYSAINARLAAQQQVLFYYFLPDTFS